MPNEPKVRLSRLAAADLESIANYTIERFGIKQARRYRDGLDHVFHTLAEEPLRGRSAAHLANEMRRFEHESHIIFYRTVDQGIFVVRILHERMDVERHAMTLT